MLQVLESCNITPSRTSLITHTYVANKMEKGIQATVFIHPPKDPKFAYVLANSVYLNVCNENTPFEEFEYSCPNAVVLTIPMYITLLQFFRSNWPKIKSNLDIQFSKIRKQALPIELDPYIHFSLAATCCYEMSIGDARLYFRKTTDDDDLPNLFSLERQGKCVCLNADTMQKLAEASVQTLVNTLYKAGYEDQTVQSEHE